MRLFQRFAVSFCLLLAFSNLPSSAYSYDLSYAPILPPNQISIIGEGAGNAVVADGTLFNATSFNPALLSKAPHSFELLQLGFSVSNDIIGIINYAQNNLENDLKNDNLQPDNFYRNIVSGDSVTISRSLTPLDSVVANITGKSVQVGLGANVLSVKIANTVGIQVYNSTHAIGILQQGALTRTLTGIPLNAGSATTSGAANAAATLRGVVAAGVSQTLTASEAASISSLTTKYQDGTLSLEDYAQQAVSTLVVDGFAIDQNAVQSQLKDNIINQIAGQVAYADVLAYTDTVGMLTVAFNPMENFPLTVGLNGKVVNRLFSWSSLSPSTASSTTVDHFRDNIKTLTTRWGVDVGFLYDLGDQLNLGLSFQDLIKQSATIPITDKTNPLYGFTTDPAPTVTRLGASWQPIKEFTLNGDLDDLFSTTSYYTKTDLFSHFRFGSALTLAGILQLRGGFTNSNFAFGAGVNLVILGVDYSYAADDLTHAFNHYAQVKLLLL